MLDQRGQWPGAETSELHSHDDAKLQRSLLLFGLLSLFGISARIFACKPACSTFIYDVYLLFFFFLPGLFSYFVSLPQIGWGVLRSASMWWARRGLDAAPRFWSFLPLSDLRSPLYLSNIVVSPSLAEALFH